MEPMTPKLVEENDLTPPKWLTSRVHFEVLAGSHAFGTSNEDSDRDLVGFCMPPMEVLFPVLDGSIPGFGRQKQSFEIYDEDHLSYRGDSWDITMFSITRFYATCMDANPTWLEALFVPEECVLFETKVGEETREHRELFLHQGAFHRFTGYASSMINKMRNKDKSRQRRCKYGYHAVRLVDELDEIFTEGTLTLGRCSDRHRAIRQGEWSFDEIESYVDAKEEETEELYDNGAAVPYTPDEKPIKDLLLRCLWREFGKDYHEFFDLVDW